MALDWKKVISELWEPIQDNVLPCIVGLCWSDQFADECEGENIFELHDVKPNIASGCIYEFDDNWYFLTAGHVLKNIKEDRDKGRVQFRFEYLHGLSQEKHSKIPITFDEKENVPLYRSSGMDYGLVPISDEVRQQMVDSGVRCAPTCMVAHPDESFDGYILIGFPSKEFVIMNLKDTEHRREADIFIGIPSLPIERLSEEDIPNVYKEHDPFVGRIMSLRGRYSTGKSVVLETIKGMSGAPIFGFRINDEGLKLQLVAVQSDWIKAKGIIAGSRLCYLVALLVMALEKHQENSDNEAGEL